jgi:hypothetical protein
MYKDASFIVNPERKKANIPFLNMTPCGLVARSLLTSSVTLQRTSIFILNTMRTSNLKGNKTLCRPRHRLLHNRIKAQQQNKYSVDNDESDLKEIRCKRELNSSGSGYGLVVGPNGNGNKYLVKILVLNISREETMH